VIPSWNKTETPTMEVSCSGRKNEAISYKTFVVLPEAVHVQSIASPAFRTISRSLS
jgi:hypothetical protein